MNIVVLGPQGSGKGTQAELLSEKYNLLHVETGEILRKLTETTSPLAGEVRDIMNEGKLVSDEILEKVLRETLNKPNGSGFVFDGTPRNVVQYGLIEKILKSKGEKFDKIVLINISEPETIKRLSSRRTCEECGKVYNLVTNPPKNGKTCDCGGRLIQREDDKPESIKKRLQTYHEQTSKVIDSAKKDGILVEIDGERPIDEIFCEISSIVDKLKYENSPKN